MLFSSRLQGLHHVAQKLMMTGLPSFWMAEDCTEAPSTVLRVMFCGILAFWASEIEN